MHFQRSSNVFNKPCLLKIYGVLGVDSVTIPFASVLNWLISLKTYLHISIMYANVCQWLYLSLRFVCNIILNLASELAKNLHGIEANVVLLYLFGFFLFSVFMSLIQKKRFFDK